MSFKGLPVIAQRVRAGNAHWVRLTITYSTTLLSKHVSSVLSTSRGPWESQSESRQRDKCLPQGAGAQALSAPTPS